MFQRPSVVRCKCHDDMVLPRSVLDLPMTTADAALASVVARQASALLQSLPDPARLADQVHRLVCQSLRGQVPTVRAVAHQLGTSVRTLHRQLGEEGTSYREIVDQVRRDLAFGHVRDGRLPLGEIAFALGFSESSAFHRAFRRWTGQAPVAWRRATVDPN